jgi:alkanesulfonate monooxygenase SsuD/methylene tetrahydromethanopterin reductase-like flavin-dependent oxidoreductase (luciferase family)
MRAGIVILPELRWAQARVRWERAEYYGFHHAWTYDHIGWRDLVDGPWFDAVPTLAAAALTTTRMEIGPLVASPNFRHPVHFAREITALDDLSQGRLLLGVGAGGAGYDADVTGSRRLTPDQRVERYVEFVDLLDRLLTNERTDWTGEHYRAVDARAAPGCVQKPRVPFLLAASGMRSLRHAARFGEDWITTGLRRDDLDEWWCTVGDLMKIFVDEAEAVGMPASTRRTYLQLDAAPVYSLCTTTFFAEAVERAAALGFTDVVSHWPRAEGWYAGSEDVLDAVAADVLPRLGT